ncbi:SCO family protein [Bradyrhizobium tropiciagri]|uniref:SCO family protein n=1 Tax=Bradyrhizobium tropiciagri TaxID=312253 RepID=UPI001BA58ECA|nr:SCO family protein [Bradyrhizobium tropiciagri]MBR0896700.1 SCO family protein [Bradyrhizobium tropiciagri]
MSDCRIGHSANEPATQPGGTFELVDHHGCNVSDRSYRGQFMLLFFGFTHCRAICPAALSRLSRVIDRLGAVASRLRPLYVTVDPERDTPEVMKAFIERSYPRFTGLTGSRENIDHVKSVYRVFARRAADPDDPRGYQMPHTAFTYLIGPDGRYVTHFTDAAGEDEIVHQLVSYLGSGCSSP